MLDSPLLKFLLLPVVVAVVEQELLMEHLVAVVQVVLFMIQVKQFLTLVDPVVMVLIQSQLEQVDVVVMVVPT
tara:strand:- start:268 stop:486 length:219 start_codon:yes stop_codon:yes gene_type:complete